MICAPVTVFVLSVVCVAPLCDLSELCSSSSLTAHQRWGEEMMNSNINPLSERKLHLSVSAFVVLLCMFSVTAWSKHLLNILFVFLVRTTFVIHTVAGRTVICPIDTVFVNLIQRNDQTAVALLLPFPVTATLAR